MKISAQNVKYIKNENKCTNKILKYQTKNNVRF